MKSGLPCALKIFLQTVADVYDFSGRDLQIPRGAFKNLSGRLVVANLPRYQDRIEIRRKSHLLQQRTQAFVPIRDYPELEPFLPAAFQRRSYVFVHSPAARLRKLIIQVIEKCRFNVRQPGERLLHHAPPRQRGIIETLLVLPCSRELPIQLSRGHWPNAALLGHARINRPHRRPRLHQRASGIECDRLNKFARHQPSITDSLIHDKGSSGA